MKRLLCYAHFDANGEVRPFVLHALQAMSPLCADTIFVSNSPLTDGDRDSLLSRCSRVLINNNTGYDFYMWKLALESADLSQYDEVILMNSSIYGPIMPIETVFAEMDTRDCDFWGITECFQRQPHVQSYFLVFKKGVITSPAFTAFWEGVLPYRDKLQVIMSYETGLTRWMLESGFRMGVYRGFESLAPFCAARGKRIRKNDNVTLKFPVELLCSGSPFLKKELILKGVFDLNSVRTLLDDNHYPVELFHIPPPAGSVACPLCGTAGRLRQSGVRDYLNLHDARRYDYHRCTSPDCGVLWLHNAPATRPTPQPAFRCQTAEGALFVCDEHEMANMEAGTFASMDLGDELTRSDNPRKLLSECNRLLQPGGTLMVRSPNANALTLALFGSYWYGLNAPRNRIILTRASLHALLKSTGYTGIRQTVSAADTGEYLLHSMNIALNRWTYPGLSAIPGLKFISAALRMACFLGVVIMGNRGDICRAEAQKAT
jgi:rhamnosyltransferase